MKNFLLGIVFVLGTVLCVQGVSAGSLDAVCEQLQTKIDQTPVKYGVYVHVLNRLAERYALGTSKYTIVQGLLGCLENPESRDNRDTGQSGQEDDVCKQSVSDLVRSYRRKTFEVSSEEEIRAALVEAKERSDESLRYEIVVRPGEYTLSNGFWLDMSHIIIRGQTNNPHDVTLQGKGMDGGVTHVFRVAASDVIIGDMAIGSVANHPIQVHGEKDADNFLLHNAYVFDGKEQLLKGSYDKDNSRIFSDNGTVQCSTFVYTKGIGEQRYMGGIDVHHGKDWLVQYNNFAGIRSPEDKLSEHAVHFWTFSEGTVVRGNTITNCDRGIGFGLGAAGHGAGVIEGNFITHDDSRGDVGIGLENAHDVVVSGNIVEFENDYPNAIEYRFAGTYDVIISNNTVNRAIVSRNGGQAEVSNNK